MKIGESEKLYTHTTEGIILTAAGEVAAREGQKELDALGFVPGGRKAKVVAQDNMRKVHALIMRKDTLATKIWHGKRGELRNCEKASGVRLGDTVVHAAGVYVGRFEVCRAKAYRAAKRAGATGPGACQ